MSISLPVDHESANTVDALEQRREFQTQGLFPAAALNTPILAPKDIAGLVAAIVITLGPLAAYSLGWGA